MSIKIKCACGYKNNGIDDLVCQMCSQRLDPNNRWNDHSGAPGGGKGGRGVGDVSLGINRSVARGAAKTIATKSDGPSEDQIVYVGDFAIVYLFLVAETNERIILTPSEVFTFGRGDHADHKIDSRAVSRRHARIHWSGDTPEIVDLDSKNGILVNGQPVKRKPLEDGDEISVGPLNATLRVVPANDIEGATTTTPDRLSATMVSTTRLIGEVRLISVTWLLQHLERLKESGTLTVYGDDEGGYVAFISGVPIAAACGEDLQTTGVQAIEQIARIRSGRFCFSPNADAAPQSIGKSIGEIFARQPPGTRRHGVQGGGPGTQRHRRAGPPPSDQHGRRPPPPPGRRRPPPRRPPPPGR